MSARPALRRTAAGNRCPFAQWGLAPRALAAIRKMALPFALGAALWGAAASAADVQDRLKHRWHSIEVVIFQRPAVREETTAETLWRQGKRSYPRGFSAFRSDVPGAGYRLALRTRASLEFPTLSFTEPPRPPEDWRLPAELRNLASAAPLEEASPLAKPAAGKEIASAAQSPALAHRQAGRPPPPIAPSIESHPLLDLLSAALQFENSLKAASYRLSGDGRKLERAARRIGQADDLELLWHGRWVQPVPPRGRPEPLLIQAGPRRRGHYLLEGIMDVTAGGYLHFHAQLWLQETPPGPRHMALDESRAMRSGDLHYLDHPKLGILVRIDPVAPSRRLLEASAAFEAAEGGN